MEKLEQCFRGINDCTLWDQVLGDHFYHLVEFLVTTSPHGVTQDSCKFVFRKMEVDSIGFLIKEESFTPLAATVEDIRQFS